MAISVADHRSGIRCFFDPWIRDGKIIPDPGSDKDVFENTFGFHFYEYLYYRRLS
jgi:hypothetical protein